jgi:hypothetical protein
MSDFLKIIVGGFLALFAIYLATKPDKVLCPYCGNIAKDSDRLSSREIDSKVTLGKNKSKYSGKVTVIYQAFLVKYLCRVCRRTWEVTVRKEI